MGSKSKKYFDFTNITIFSEYSFKEEQKKPHPLQGSVGPDGEGREIGDSIPIANLLAKKIFIYLHFLQVYNDVPSFCYFLHSSGGCNFHFSKESLGSVLFSCVLLVLLWVVFGFVLGVLFGVFLGYNTLFFVTIPSI